MELYLVESVNDVSWPKKEKTFHFCLSNIEHYQYNKLRIILQEQIGTLVMSDMAENMLVSTNPAHLTDSFLVSGEGEGGDRKCSSPE